jgi:hypothetical protein
MAATADLEERFAPEAIARAFENVYLRAIGDAA